MINLAYTLTCEACGASRVQTVGLVDLVHIPRPTVPEGWRLVSDYGDGGMLICPNHRIVAELRLADPSAPPARKDMPLRVEL